MTEAAASGIRRRLSTGWRAAVCLVLGVVLALYQLAPQHDAWWGLQDDLVPLSYRPPGATLRVGDIPAVIATTEAAQFGSSVRYRPIYYITRVLELWALGAHPRRWYVEHTLWYGLVTAALTFAVWTMAGPWLAVGALLLFTSGWYQRDIWSHLGTSEPYASLGLAAVAIGYSIGWQSGARSTGLWLAACGTMFAVGCKENFAVLLVPTVLLAWHHRRAHPKTAVVASLLAMAAVAVVALSVTRAVHGSMRDEYGTTIDASTRLGWLFGMTGAMLAALWILAAVVLLPKFLALRNATGAAGVARRSALQHAVLLLIVITALVASQATYYGPVWPRFGGRYDYPGRLAEPLLFVGAVGVAMQLLRLDGRARRAEQLAVAGVLVCVVLAARHGFVPARRAAQSNRDTTRAIRNRLDEAIAAAPPGTPIVIAVHGETEFLEPAQAAIVLLAELGSRGPFLMRADSADPRFVTRLASRTAAGLRVAGQRVDGVHEAGVTGRHVVVAVHGYGPPDVQVMP